MKRIAGFIVVLFFFPACLLAQNATKEIARVGGTPVYADEFLYVYNKNNDRKKENPRDYLSLFINFKLKIREAEALRLDTGRAFRQEYETYRKQLAQPYLTDREFSEKLVKEAYDRYGQEISAAHILVNVAPAATPADTLKAYQKITDLRKRALAGEDFGQLARQHSEDPSAQSNGGNLGYFTSMQMVYPFETAAYQTGKGEISQPVRSQFGYHLVKVLDKRPSMGQVQVQHIMIRTFPGMEKSDSIRAKSKIDELYQKLLAGGNWDELCRQFTEDQNSKEKAGKLDWFGVGGIEPAFEEVAFSLAKPGDISKPVQTPYGWHIIRLMEKKPLDPFEKMQTQIKNRINRDSRGEISRKSYLQKLKKENRFTETKNAKTLWTLDSASALGQPGKQEAAKTLFTIAGKPYSQADFMKHYQGSRHKKEKFAQGWRAAYEEFTANALLAYEESQLENKYPEYRLLAREYREGILLFQLMDEKVWSKAVSDTAGLRVFFERNRPGYQVQETATATLMSFEDSLDWKRTTDSLSTKGSMDTEALKLLSVRLNRRNPLNFQFSQGKYTREEASRVGVTNWTAGSQTFKKDGRYHLARIEKINPPAPANLDDIRGQVISDYQKFLEEQWLEELRRKYPVVIDEKAISAILAEN